MNTMVKVVSYMALAMLVVAPVLFYVQRVTLEMNKLLMLIATVIWFASALCWIGRREN